MSSASGAKTGQVVTVDTAKGNDASIVASLTPEQARIVMNDAFDMVDSSLDTALSTFIARGITCEDVEFLFAKSATFGKKARNMQIDGLIELHERVNQGLVVLPIMHGEKAPMSWTAYVTMIANDNGIDPSTIGNPVSQITSSEEARQMWKATGNISACKAVSDALGAKGDFRGVKLTTSEFADLQKKLAAGESVAPTVKAFRDAAVKREAKDAADKLPNLRKALEGLKERMASGKADIMESIPEVQRLQKEIDKEQKAQERAAVKAAEQEDVKVDLAKTAEVAKRAEAMVSAAQEKINAEIIANITAMDGKIAPVWVLLDLESQELAGKLANYQRYHVLRVMFSDAKTLPTAVDSKEIYAEMDKAESIWRKTDDGKRYADVCKSLESWQTAATK